MSVQSFIAKSVIRSSRSLFQTSRRYRGSAAIKIVASPHAEAPLEVLSIHGDIITEPKNTEVVLEMLTVPVNPEDIHVIEGKYPQTFKQPFVPGYEGVARVQERGTEVAHLKEGDHVVPLRSNLGTWRTHMTVPADILRKVPKEIELTEAATLTWNSSTAYTMLKNFINLNPGDTIIQNGGNSSVGQLVIQLCKLWEINSVSVIRDRPDVDKLKEHLKALGATYVFTEAEIRTTDIFKTGRVSKPKLGLNCVGGESANELARHLQDDSYLVTYGNVTEDPIVVPDGIRAVEFSITSWAEEKPGNAEKRRKMLDQLVAYHLEGTLKVPNCTTVDYSQFKEAISNTIDSNREIVKQKYFLRFNDL